jgi:uncharacterized membrane protein
MRNLAEAAARAGTVLPPAYYRLFWTWFACGFPAFAAVLAILWLMTSRPMFSLVLGLRVHEPSARGRRGTSA